MGDGKKLGEGQPTRAWREGTAVAALDRARKSTMDSLGRESSSVERTIFRAKRLYCGFVSSALGLLEANS
jgi:hypothetical protein